MSNVFPRHTRVKLPVAASGNGCYLVDTSGKQYLDGSGGAAVSCLGHDNKAVKLAIQEQLDRFAFAHTGFFTSDPAEELASLLISKAPKGIDRAFLVSGGSEAVEAALKLARQFFVEKGELHRTHIIARRQSYHGNTLGALAAGGNEWRRKQFSPLLTDFSHIAPCYEYAERADSESSWDYGQRTARALEDEILRLGPDTVIAFLAEPVVGATSGAVPAVDGYFKQIREICNKYGVLLILDEVMCGMGRTGYLFASEYDDIAPDIVCIAKGLGAGYQPIGAMLCQSEIYQAISEGSGFFQHGHTYLGHPVAAAAGCAVFKELDSKDLVSRVHDLGPRFESALREQFLDHQMVGDIRGRGLFWAIELVSNKETKEPFDPALRLAANIKKAAFENGLICYPMAGTRDGVNGDHVLLAPPFIIDDSQIEELIGKLASAIDVCTPQHTAA